MNKIVVFQTDIKFLKTKLQQLDKDQKEIFSKQNIAEIVDKDKFMFLEKIKGSFEREKQNLLSMAQQSSMQVI